MKRLISILLCLACFLGVLVSCQGAPETKTRPKSSETQTNTRQALASSTSLVITAPASSTVPPTSTLSEEEKAQNIIEDARYAQFKNNITLNVAKAMYTLRDDKSAERDINSIFERIHYFYEEKKRVEPDYKVDFGDIDEYVTYIDGAFIIDNCLWNFYDYKMTKEFTVPASVTRIKGGYTHNSHEFEWFGFSLNDTIEKVIFEKGSKIEVIEEDAFSECASLKAVVIPSDVEIDLSVFPEGITIERY